MRISSGFIRNGQIVINVPEATSKAKPKSAGGQIIMRTSGLSTARKRAKAAPRSIKTALEVTASERAQRLQATLQGALAAEYSKTGTGRFARSIRVGVIKKTVAGRSQTILQVKAIPYRETKFITNLAGTGYFKDFPVGPYRIYAKGAQRIADIVSGSGRALAKAIRLGGGAARLKVPRAGRFFTAGRQPGRGGGESRTINDALGAIDPGDRQGSFFFYPLWVTHPGFRRDLLSELVVLEGGTYQEEVIRAVGDRATLASKALVASGQIPVGEASVRQTESRTTKSIVTIPVFLKRVR